MSNSVIKRAIFDEGLNAWVTSSDKIFKVGQVLNFADSSSVVSALDRLKVSYEELLFERGSLQETLANSFLNFRVQHEKPPENYDELNSKLAHQSLKLAAYTDRTGFYKSMAELAIFSELGYLIGLSMKFTLEGDGLIVTVAPPREGELQHENIASMGASVSEYVSEGAKFAALITNLRPAITAVFADDAISGQEVSVEHKVPAISLPVSLWPKMLGMFGWIFASIDSTKLVEVFPEIFTNVISKDEDAVYILGSGAAGQTARTFLHVIPTDAIEQDGDIGINIKKLAYSLSATTPDLFMNEFVLETYTVFKTVDVGGSRIPVAATVTKNSVMTYSQSQINGMAEPDTDTSKSAFNLEAYKPLTDCIRNA